MPTEAFLALSSLLGVVLGGALSYLAQSAASRAAECAQRRREDTQRAEARRSERLLILDRMLVAAQEAERIAVNRHFNADDGEEWGHRANAAMDRLWVAEKMVRIACTSAMHDAAHEFARSLNEAIWGQGVKMDIFHYLAPSRSAFLEAAGLELQDLRDTAPIKDR